LPCTRRGFAPAPHACAAGGRALPCTRWGFAPDPEMLAHLCLACGRDGGCQVFRSKPCLSAY
ncbi:hypothetical protein D7X33_17080, partial [Butyricicoccus sp. 1XD8-22]